nr:hypothetical protein [Tanacetum cinerariifolium]
MNVNEFEYFSQILEIGFAYRICNFSCAPTISWQQPLENKTSLKFGRYTNFEAISEAGFPNHFFDLVLCNQPSFRIHWPFDQCKFQHHVLPDDIGCVRSVGDLIIYGDLHRRHIIRRKGVMLTSGTITACVRAPIVVFSFFNPSVDAISGHACSELVQKLDTTDPEQVASEVLENERKRHKFRFHFNTSSKLGAVDFILEDVLDEATNNDGTVELCYCAVIFLYCQGQENHWNRKLLKVFKKWSKGKQEPYSQREILRGGYCAGHLSFCVDEVLLLAKAIVSVEFYAVD